MTRHAYFFGRGLAPRIAAALGLLALSTGTASAIPAFAEQTQQPCSACHVGSFGPQLTPFGRQFKLEGYTMRAGEDFTNPLSAMAIMSFVNTAADQAPPPPKNYAVNNNAAVDQISLFVAGGINQNFGGFTQWTYNGISHAFSWDNLDLRAILHTSLFDTDVLLGLGVNNAPGVQDSWQTLPAWGFPFTGSGLAPSPGATPLLAGHLAQTVLGVSAYAYWDSKIYTEAAIYWQPGTTFLSAMGAIPGDTLSGAAPYFRVAYQQDYGTQNFEVGAFALISNILPGGVVTGTSDQFSDYGVDGSYQYMGDSSDIYQVDARFTHEAQHLAASLFLGNTAKLSNSLDDFRVDASYYWQNVIGGSAGFFNTTGSTDTLLYGGNTAFKPDSTGFTFQLDGTIFGQDMDVLGGRFNVRAGIQYTLYTKFDGASTNYDGTLRNASDNNTLRIFLWTAL